MTKIFKQTGLIASGAETLLSLSDSKGHDTTICRQSLSIASPDLWSPDSPTLYTAVSQLYADGILKDEYVTTFGVKNLEIIPQKGMFLNGEPFKFKGVCLHHDLGPLGAAVNRSAISRQLSLLKEMGCNAIRTAHNMPAPELVELCDRMGFMLIAESFDEWEFPKCVNGYHLYFNKWAEKDLTNLVKHYRNNPSVALWSIGNEVPDMAHPGAVQKLRRLQDVCHREDPTRKVTMGMDMGQQSLDNYCAATIDVPGLNYRLNFYHRYYQSLPQQTVLGTETVSSFSSRGEYFFPVERTADTKHVERQSSSYDVECASWGNLPEDDWVFQDDYPWCIGEFVWTGFDYLGEPTPYNEWPNHSSTFGIIDLAGIPKDRYFLYRSRWNSGQQTVHIVPHWTWPGREGQITPVFVYTNHPSAELFVNGHSQGRRHKNTSLTEESTAGEEASRQLLRQSRYRLMWPDVKYEAGTLKVVCYDVNGKIVAEKKIHTAGKPHHLELTADRSQLSADGKDLAFITVRVVDKDGNLCPAAKHAIRFKVSGEGLFRAAANGDPTCLEPFRLPEMHAFNGQLTAIVQSTEKAGKITFEAQTQGVKKCSLNLITIKHKSI